MKVYRTQKSIFIHIQPGNEVPMNSEWKDTEGNAIMFSIIFVNHAAEVTNSIGRYMIDRGLAFKSLQAAEDAEPRIVSA